MNKRIVVGASGLLVAILAGAVWWTGRQEAGDAEEAAPRAAVAPSSPWWGASGPAAGLPVAEVSASGAEAMAEAARLREAYDRLSPEDRAAVDQARAYEGFMGRMQALLAAGSSRVLNPAEAQQVMDEVDAFQREDYYSLSHALQLKMAVARMAWQGSELNSRLAAMQQQFEREHAALVAKSDPSKDPTFVAFKAEETAMIAQARRMATFPDGLTRDQYIIRESEKIRARHYPD
jgi:hypothetical protein